MTDSDADADRDVPPSLPPPVTVRLTTLPTHPCPYLPGLEATTRAFRTNRLPTGMYHDFMDAGFRRSGRVIYQPVCDACRRCIPIRVPVDTFIPGKSQRRTARRNSDLQITVNVPVPTDEKFDLYQSYQKTWHSKVPDPDEDARQAFESFLYQSPVDSLEFCYRTPEGKLAAIGIADVCTRSFSSVYFYFDPELSERGLGTFGALHELQWASQRGIPYYYLGFWVNGCEKMNYKSNFRPYQLLGHDGLWHDVDDAVLDKLGKS